MLGLAATPPYDPAVLCPDVVGRDGELAALRQRLDEVAAGRGGVVALVGEAGAGKSRLLQVLGEEVRAAGLPVLSGRAVPGPTPVPYRPLVEALLAAFRGAPSPEDPTLAGFEAHLGRLVPSWATGEAAEDSPVLLAEALVRLLAVVAGERACVLLLEDLHWADPETVAVVDYLADALRDEPVLCVVTTRPGGAAAEVLDRLDRRRPGAALGAVLGVDHLDQAGIDRMVAACLATSHPPAGLGEFVGAHSDGNPFLVEELLAGLVAGGQLREDTGRWQITGPLTPAVPATLRQSIEQRLAALDGDARRVVGAAALLGRHFDWELLPGIAEVDARAAADALRAAVAEQLIESDGDGFVFRHALTREAVLAALLPPERRQLASRAWPVVERANPGLPGPTCELAAELAEAAGDRTAAAERLLESARRALAAGALATAEATALRAQRLARDDPAVAADVDEVLVHVLVAAGKPAAAIALGRDLAGRLAAAGATAIRQADLLVALARAAVAAGDLPAGSEAVAEARAAVGPDPAPPLLARIDTVAAEVALDRAELADAEQLARRAVDGARATAQPGVECEALLVLGRVFRPTDKPAASAAFRRAAEVAAGAGLARWHLRAQHELALEAWITEGPRALEETRALAARYGAHITVAVMDLGLADLALSSFDRQACLRHAADCVDASHRYGLATEPVANLWLAGAHALAGDDAAMQSAIEAALARDPDDPRILGDLYGRVLPTRAFVQDELGSLRSLLDTMAEHVRRAPPTTSVYPGRILRAFLHTAEDDDLGAGARAELAEAADRLQLPMFHLAVEVAEAVALGRAGDRAGAEARFGPSYEALLARPVNVGLVHVSTLLVAPAAVRDGWGDPVRWLREAEAFMTDRGFDRLARRCRTMLVDAGAPAPRRRGDTEVPTTLRALGVTGREVDVLKLVVAGRSNKEIAAELVLSPKTVERHLSSLFARLGVTNRRQLADVGVAHL